MYGPVVPPSRPLNRSSEIRQYAANEWHSNHYQLVLEAERLADEERRKAMEARDLGKTRSLRKLWASGLRRIFQSLARR
jgi:hypothetical protein